MPVRRRFLCMSISSAAFLTALQADAGLWRSVDARVVAVWAEGAWRNLITQCYLRGKSPSELFVLPQQVRSPLLRAEQHLLPVEALPELLAAVERGAWGKANGEVTYFVGQFDSTGSRPYGLSNHHFHSLDSQHVHPDFTWSGHVLHGSGDNCSTIIQRVAGSWDALDAVAHDQLHPFERFDELVQHVTGLQTATAGRNSTFEVFAPYEVRLVEEMTGVDDGRVYFFLEAGSYQAAKACRLRVLPEARREEVPASNVLPATPEWRPHDDGMIAYAGEHLTPGANAATLVFACGTRTVRWLRVRTYSSDAVPVPLATYRLLDPELAMLETWLSGTAKPNPQEKFECGVGRLFVLAGFQVDQLSTDKRLSDAVDLMAHAPRQQVCLVVECTTGSVDLRGKLGMFVKRIEEVRRAVSEVKVIGVLVTSTPLAGTSQADLARAHADALVVVTGDDLGRLLQLVRAGTSAGAVLEYLQQECRRRQGAASQPVLRPSARQYG